MDMFRIMSYISAAVILAYVACMLGCAGVQRSGGDSYADKKELTAGTERPASRKKTARGLGDSEAPREPSGKEDKKDSSGERMIIYTAKLDIEVDKIKDTLDRVERITGNYDGFIESVVTSDSYKKSKVVVRVPVSDFEKAIKELSKLGTVTGRSVSASDITMEFQDISLRLETNKKIRDRLYRLLKRTSDPEQKVKILREIEKLDKKIETLRATIEYLRSKADFSTITLHLTAKVREVVHRYIPSPFPWVARISSEKRTIFNDSFNIEYDKPPGFFDVSRSFFNKEKDYMFKPPRDECGIRMGMVDNYPPADSKFWTEAVLYEFKNRYYSNVDADKKEVNGFKNIVVTLKGGTVYSLFFRVMDDTILVVEAAAVTAEVYKKHRSNIEKFIKSIHE